MLNTKDMSAGSGKAKPVIGVGNQVIRINSISFDVTLMIVKHIILCYM